MFSRKDNFLESFYFYCRLLIGNCMVKYKYIYIFLVIVGFNLIEMSGVIVND